MGHFAGCCGKFKNCMGSPLRGNSNAVRRTEYVAGENSSEDSYDETPNKIVLTIGGSWEAPFVLNGRINHNNITAMIDSGLPVTIFTTQDLKITFWRSTVKEDEIVKTALDAIELKKATVKENYQMPNMDHLVDLVGEKLDKTERQAWFKSLDVQNTCGQKPFDRRAAQRWLF